MKNSQLSLKAKLLVLTLGSMLLLAASALLMMNRIIGVQTHAQTKTFEDYASSLDASISAQIYERYGDVQAFALNPSIRASNKKTIVELLNAYAAMYGIYDLILVVNSSGKLIAVNDKSPSGEALKVDALYQENFESSEWFKATMAEHFTDDKKKGYAGTYVEDINVDPTTSLVFGSKRLGNSFSAPIKDESGKTIGVITNRAAYRWFDVAFKDTYQLLKDRKLKGADLKLVSKDGVLLYEYNATTADAKSDEQRFDWGSLFKRNLKTENNLAYVASQESAIGSGIFDGSNGSRMIGYTKVDSPKAIDSLGWTVLVEDSADEALEEVSNAKKLFYLIFITLIVLAALFSYRFSAKLSNTLMVLAKDLSTGGGQVAVAASEISQSSGKLSDASVAQASAIQETAASIDEVSAMVKKNADNATHSQVTSRTSRASAEKGQKSVEKMIQSISEISDSNEMIMKQVVDGNSKISDIVVLIQEIGNKTKIINDIVFQTKLLSFNASVEAARAGEHGKGFAVVAEEVGNLAQMSGNAAKEISDMLSGSIQKVESIVKETKASVDSLVSIGKSKVDQGMQTAQECGEALSQILTAVQELDLMVEEISSASREQSQGVDEINKAMNQLDNSVQQNTGASQKSANLAKNLSQQSSDLQVLVESLHFLIEGGKASSHQQDAIVNVNVGKEAASKTQNTGINTGTMMSKSASMSASELPSHEDSRFDEI